LISLWSDAYGAIAMLELLSGEYEAWARSELMNLSSPINREGMALARKLSNERLWYLALWEDENGPGFDRCPLDGGPLELDHYLLCRQHHLALSVPERKEA
jgi:hypothetical protein